MEDYPIKEKIKFKEICKTININSFLNNGKKDDSNNFISVISEDKCITVTENIFNKFISHYGCDINYNLIKKNKQKFEIVFNYNQYKCDFYLNFNNIIEFQKQFLDIINDNNNNNAIKNNIIKIFKLNIPLKLDDFECKINNDKINILFKNKTSYAINKIWYEQYKQYYKYYHFGKIINNECLIDINSFLNDGDYQNIENKILKKDSYVIITNVDWEALKKYGYDIELDSKIIKNNQKKEFNLIFFYNDIYKNKIQKFPEVKIYLSNEDNLIKTIVKCLNSNGFKSKQIRSFYQYNNKIFEDENFIYNKKSDNTYIISFNDNKSIQKERKMRNNNEILIGLNNLGATCFMNAVLQILNNIKKFRDFLCSLDINSRTFPISYSLQDVFINLKNSNNISFSPGKFRNIIATLNPKFLKNEPNDSRRLIQFLLNSIHKELNINKNKNYLENVEEESTELTWEKKLENEKTSFNYENKSIIIDLFYGIQAIETVCSNCSNTSYEFEHFNILTLPILQKYTNKISINNMLDDFSRKIQLIGRNRNYCSICKDEYNAYTRNIFYEMPEILIIHPGRTNKGIKYNIIIDFSEKIKIKLGDNFNLKTQEIKYNLIGLIYHFGGSGYSGHNIAYCKIMDKWYEFDDERVSPIDFKNIKGEGIILLIYQK